MARKIGDVAIALSILIFVLGGLSIFLIQADNSTDFDGGMTSETFENLAGQNSDLKEMQNDLNTKTDEVTSFGDEDDEKGGDTSGLMNLVSKNIVTNLVMELETKVPGSKMVLGFLMGIVGLTIMILFIRSFVGEGKV